MNDNDNKVHRASPGKLRAVYPGENGQPGAYFEESTPEALARTLDSAFGSLREEVVVFDDQGKEVNPWK